MRRAVRTRAVGLLLAATASSACLAPAARPAAVPVPVRARPVVAIDPGHNGANGRNPRTINRLVDAGGFRKACNTVGASTNAGYSEAQFNWDVAQLVAARLETSGIAVVLTRPDNAGVGPCIDERAAIANRAGAAALLSIHGDGGPPAGRGFHVIEPMRIAGYTDDIVDESHRLATEMIGALVAGGFQTSTYAGTRGRSPRRDLGTLNRSDVPAVIVEIGNMRNAADAAVMSDGAGRERIADALVAGLRAFLDAPASAGGATTGAGPTVGASSKGTSSKGTSSAAASSKGTSSKGTSSKGTSSAAASSKGASSTAASTRVSARAASTVFGPQKRPRES